MKTNKVFFAILLVFLPLLNFAQNSVEIKLSLVEKKLPFGLTKFVPSQKPKIGLALSGGGSRAISHVGVLKALEVANIPIDYIVGTSMGSVVGGLYSAGYSTSDLESMFLKLNWEDLFFLTGADRANLFVDQKITEDKSLLTIRLNGLSPVVPQSINTGHKISNFLISTTLNSPLNSIENFDNLLYKFRAVSTELVSGKKIVLNKGSLSEAMRASSSVSFLLPPIKMDSMLLVDGGLVDNLPIKTLEELQPDLIIASDATSNLRNKDELVYPWEIADQLVSIPSRMILENNKKYADVIISHKLKNVKNDNFIRLKNIINEGYASTKYKSNDIYEIYKQKYLKNLASEGDKYLKFSNDLKELFSTQSIDYSHKNSILKSEALFILSELFETGNYKNISLVLNENRDSIIAVNKELNSTLELIELKGITLIPLDSAYSLFSNNLEKPYNVNKALNSILNLIKFYRHKGYMLPTVTDIYFNENIGVLAINVDEAKIDSLKITGNENTLSAVIEREFSPLEDGYLMKENFDESLENLSTTDLFDNIIVTHSEEEKNTLKLSLDEKLPNVLRFGLRIDNENFTQFAIDLRNENLFGTGSELGVSISGGSRNMSYILEHKTNRIFETYLTYKAQAFYKYNDVNVYADDYSENEKKFSRSRISEYSQRFYGGFVGIGAHLKKLGTLTAEAKYEVNEVKSLYSFPSESEYKSDISSLRFRLQIDSQNKYPYPTKGIYINSFYETAQKILGGDISFAKFSFDYSGYFTLANRHTLKPHFTFGFADETLPLSQQFNFGGQGSFLGYREFEYRGRQILIGSLEYRYMLPINFYFDTYLKFRYDIGSSWVNQEQIHFDDLKHGLGLTVSFDTPIGPADFSIGRSLYIKDTSPERIISRGPLMFYFTIGYYY